MNYWLVHFHINFDEMKIYRLKTDTKNVQIVSPVDQSKITKEFGTFDCESRLNNWEELIFYVYNPKIKQKNFYSMFSGALIFDQKVLDICQSVFEMAGEILPLQVERGPKLYLLNILECMNGLDHDKTLWDYYPDGGKGRVLKYVFHKERVVNESTLFKIPETSKVDIFCFADVKDPKDEFYHLYQEHKFTGLIFNEIV
jgi:hypothetical protein